MPNIYLYHGSNQIIETPDCSHGTKGRDFGVCFYTTYSKKTAKNWAVKKFKEQAIINEYCIDLEKLTTCNLSIKHFEANAEWAEFVWNNRFNKKYERPKYDIIIGPMADKGLKKHFILYETGKATFEEIARNIQYDRFKSQQVCFCTDTALQMLNLSR